MACRNLWNFYCLDYFDEKVFELLSNQVAKNPAKLLELEVANALRAFAHFNYINYDAMDPLIRTSIARAADFNTKTLAVILNSMAELDIKNQTLFTHVKNLIMKDFHDDRMDLI